MRFSIRHLLWFTLLAAVGCWWWMPSAIDGKHLIDTSFTSSDRLTRFESLDLAPIGNEQQITFDQRDAVIVPGRTGKPHVWAYPDIKSRGHGAFVLVCFSPPEKTTSLDTLLTVAKYAHVFQVTPTQFYLIDGGVAAGLLTLAIGSLFVGRRRLVNERTSNFSIKAEIDMQSRRDDL